MQRKHTLTVNMIASLLQFALNLGIGFCLTPFIVRHLGAEAYGYVGLANNIINYASLLTVALDSVAGRFITIAYHQGNKEKADRYFSSTFMADCAIATILTAIAIPAIVNISKLINISPNLLRDVQMLFAFIFIQFVITSVSTVFTVATFITNKLYLSSLANVAFSIVRVIVMIFCFGIFPPFVAYVGLAAVAGISVSAILNYRYTKVLTPGLVFHPSLVSWPVMKEMLSTGIWNVVIKLQQLISFGLKLLVTNLMVSPYEMGMMSIAETIPNMISSLMGTIANLFYPQQTQYYAQGNKDRLVNEMTSGMRMCGAFTIVITVVCAVVGEDFFTLWQPEQNPKLLYSLMLIVLSGFLVSGAATTLQNVPLLVNKLKLYSLVWLVANAISLPLTIALLKLTNLDVYAVSIVPTAVEITMNVTFVPIYAAKVLAVRKRTFYRIYLQYFIAAIISFSAALTVKSLFKIHSVTWISFLSSCCLYGSFTLLLTTFTLLNSDERKKIVRLICKRH